MNKYWRIAFDSDLEVWVPRFILLGFIAGWLYQDWTTGIVWGVIAPFALIPVLLAFVLLGTVYELIPKKQP